MSILNMEYIGYMTIMLCMWLIIIWYMIEELWYICKHKWAYECSSKYGIWYECMIVCCIASNCFIVEY